MPQSKLGLIEAGTSGGIYDALAQLIADKQKADLLKQQEQERVERRGLEARRQTEDERRNRRTEGQDDTRIGFAGNADKRAGAGETRTQADWDRQNAERVQSRNIIEGMRPTLRTSAMLESLGGPKLKESEIQTADERGADEGAQDRAAYRGGQSEVEADKLNRLDLSALQRLKWGGEEQRKTQAAGAEEDRRTQAAPRSQAGGGVGSGLTGGQMSALAEQVVDNPDLLDKMTKKDAGAIMREIADAQRAGASAGIPNRARISADKMRDEALETLKDIRNHPGFAGAFGAPDIRSPTSLTRLTQLIPGMPAYSLPWGDPADVRAKVSQAVSRLTTPRLAYMRGLGAMSEREFASVEAGATILKNPGISESEAAKELDKMIAVMEDEKAKRGGGAGAPGATPQSGGGSSAPVIIDYKPRPPGGG